MSSKTNTVKIVQNVPKSSESEAESENEVNKYELESDSEVEEEYDDELEEPSIFHQDKETEKKILSLKTLDKGETGKKSKPGVIYLSTIPPKMNVTRIREYFSQFGDIHRSFLQPEDKPWKGKRKVKNQTFSEGWIEFKKRRHAKKVAATLNNQPVGGKKSKVYHDFLWNIKYLQGFQWVHLNERLAYERISRQQKLRNEISAAKRESSFFAKNVDLSKRLKKKGLLNKPPPKFEHKDHNPANDDSTSSNANPRKTVDASAVSKLSKKKLRKEPLEEKDRSKFLKSIFGK